MTDYLSPFCPMSPTSVHRAYYSARQAAAAGRYVPTACRDCGQNVHFVGNLWQVAPPGEILLGFVIEFESRILDGERISVMEPIGILNSSGTPASVPALSPDILRAIEEEIGGARRRNVAIPLDAIEFDVGEFRFRLSDLKIKGPVS